MNTQPPDPPRAPEAEAVASVRGYVHQFLFALDILLSEKEVDEVYVETFEDVLKRKGSVFEPVQVKSREDRFSLTQGETLEMLERWAVHAKENTSTRFVFVSTQAPGNMHDHSDAFIRWANGSRDDATFSRLHRSLRTFLDKRPAAAPSSPSARSSTRQPSPKVPADLTIRHVRKLVGNHTAFRTFFKRIQWCFSAPLLNPLFTTIVAEVRSRDSLAEPSARFRVYGWLGAIAVSAASRNVEDRRWTLQRLRSLVGEDHECLADAIRNLLGHQHEEVLAAITAQAKGLDEHLTRFEAKQGEMHAEQLARLTALRTVVSVTAAASDGVVGPHPRLLADVEALREHTTRMRKALSRHTRIDVDGASIRIRRTMAGELHRFLGAAGGIVVGDAGAGKSALLHDLCDRLASNHDIVLLLAGDPLLPRLFEKDLNHPLLTIIDGWPGTRPVYLLIDAFDEARKSTAEHLRRLIDYVTASDSRWRVVMTIRSHSLRLQPTMWAFFRGASHPTLFHEDLRSVRHIRVPPLSRAELEQVTNLAPWLRRYLATSSAGILTLITNPFNLRLLANLVVDHEGPTPAASQLGLLDQYWEHRVGADSDSRLACEVVLRRVCLDTQHSSPESPGGSLEEQMSLERARNTLLDAGLLVATAPRSSSAGVSRVTFSHETFFHYAYMRYFLAGDDRSVAARLGALEADAAFLVEPALRMRLQAFLEHGDPDPFWRLAIELADEPTLAMVLRLTPPAVAVESARDEGVLAPLRRFVTSAVPALRDAASQVLKDVFTLLVHEARTEVGRRAVAEGPWLVFLGRIADVFPATVVRVAVDLLALLIDPPSALTVRSSEGAGRAARHLLKALRTRKDPPADLVQKVIRAVILTGDSDPDETESVLRSALETPSERIEVLRSLDAFGEGCTAFVAKVFVRVLMVGPFDPEGPADPAAAFEVDGECYHALVAVFPRLLKRHFATGVRLGLDLILGAVPVLARRLEEGETPTELGDLGDPERDPTAPMLGPPSPAERSLYAERSVFGTDQLLLTWQWIMDNPDPDTMQSQPVPRPAIHGFLTITPAPLPPAPRDPVAAIEEFARGAIRGFLRDSEMSGTWWVERILGLPNELPFTALRATFAALGLVPAEEANAADEASPGLRDFLKEQARRVVTEPLSPAAWEVPEGLGNMTRAERRAIAEWQHRLQTIFLREVQALEAERSNAQTPPGETLAIVPLRSEDEVPRRILGELIGADRRLRLDDEPEALVTRLIGYRDALSGVAGATTAILEAAWRVLAVACLVTSGAVAQGAVTTAAPPLLALLVDLLAEHGIAAEGGDAMTRQGLPPVRHSVARALLITTTLNIAHAPDWRSLVLSLSRDPEADTRAYIASNLHLAYKADPDFVRALIEERCALEQESSVLEILLEENVLRLGPLEPLLGVRVSSSLLGIGEKPPAEGVWWLCHLALLREHFEGRCAALPPGVERIISEPLRNVERSFRLIGLCAEFLYESRHVAQERSRREQRRRAVAMMGQLVRSISAELEATIAGRDPEQRSAWSEGEQLRLDALNDLAGHLAREIRQTLRQDGALLQESRATIPVECLGSLLDATAPVLDVLSNLGLPRASADVIEICAHLTPIDLTKTQRWASHVVAQGRRWRTLSEPGVFDAFKLLAARLLDGLSGTGDDADVREMLATSINSFLDQEVMGATALGHKLSGLRDAYNWTRP